MSMGAEQMPLAEDDPNWRFRAACLDEDPELFFPVGRGGLGLAQTEDAKEVCRRCDVRERCLAWALEIGAVGIWGATTEEERNGLKKRNSHR